MAASPLSASFHDPSSAALALLAVGAVQQQTTALMALLRRTLLSVVQRALRTVAEMMVQNMDVIGQQHRAAILLKAHKPTAVRLLLHTERGIAIERLTPIQMDALWPST